MVFKAIQTYGMVVVYQAGAVMIEAEQPSDWAAEGNTGTNPITASWDGLKTIKWSPTCRGPVFRRSTHPSN